MLALWDRWEKSRCSKPDKRNNFLSYPNRPDRHWHASIYLFGGHRGLFRRGKAARTWYLPIFLNLGANLLITGAVTSLNHKTQCMMTKYLKWKLQFYFVNYILLANSNVTHNTYKPHVWWRVNSSKFYIKLLKPKEVWIIDFYLAWPHFKIEFSVN